MHCMQRYFLLGLLVACFGCGRGEMAPDLIQNAESAHSEALAAWEAKDYATALERFTEAVHKGGLNADLTAEALLRTAECHIELGNLDEAASVLDSLEDRVPDEDQWRLARCKLFARQGDSTKARAEFDAARLINPNLQPPPVLN